MKLVKCNKDFQNIKVGDEFLSPSGKVETCYFNAEGKTGTKTQFLHGEFYALDSFANCDRNGNFISYKHASV